MWALELLQPSSGGGALRCGRCTPRGRPCAPVPPHRSGRARPREASMLLTRVIVVRRRSARARTFVESPRADDTKHGRYAARADVKPPLAADVGSLLSLIVNAASVFLAAWFLPGLDVGDFWAALARSARHRRPERRPRATRRGDPSPVHRRDVVPPCSSCLDAACCCWRPMRSPRARSSSTTSARRSLAALVISAISTALEVVAGTNDDDAYTIRVIQRIARRSGERVETDVPGILYLEIDGLAKPVLQRAMRDGNAPTMARWLADDSHRFLEWETDLSSQTGASQAGILLGSNEDIPAFRWVEKERGIMMACSAPADCAEIERRHAGDGLLRDGGASRGNLLSGEADHVILTVSRMEAEKGANPGYRAFFANGHNVTRALVLFFWEVILEWVAALRAIRRDVQPQGSPRRDLPVHARCDVRDRPRPHRLRRPHRPDEGPAGGVCDVLELRRGRPPLGPRADRHPRGAAKARPAVRPRSTVRSATRRARTRSSSSPTTGKRRARRSSSGTATASTISSSAR